MVKRRDLLKLAAMSVVAGPAPAFAAMARNGKADVVVIGSGGAGFSAAITAHDLDAKVIVFEKMPIIGGNTQIASGGMNAAGTRYQEAAGVKDTWKLMYDDTMKGGYNRGIPALVEVFAKNSAASLDWLVSLGADLSTVGRTGGASVDRSHGPKDGGPVGPQIIGALRNSIAKRKIDVRTRSDVTHILMNVKGAVNGVLVKDYFGHTYEIEAKSVILASGGFSANLTMVTKYHPEYAGFATTNQPGATGEGITLAQELGAQLRDMDKIQIHPTLAAGTNILVTEAMRGAGAIMVNREGKRFINELSTRDVASAAILKQTGKSAFLIFDDGLRKQMALIEGYFHLGFVKEGQNPAELAKTSGIDATALAETIASYNKYKAAKSDPDFKRADMPRSIEPPKFYSIEVQPGIHYTMGGVLLNATAQAVGRNGTPIPALFAAGEVTGGVHGANRLGGNSTSETITFGRIAGSGAAAYAKKS